MAKPNYSFEKRKRELDKKQKKEEKLKRKLTKGPSQDAESGAVADDGMSVQEQGAPESPAPGGTD